VHKDFVFYYEFLPFRINGFCFRCCCCCFLFFFLLLVFCDGELVEFDGDELDEVVPLCVAVPDDDDDDNSSGK
jgi:hypothetical protein